jgi:hypothetical protein
VLPGTDRPLLSAALEKAARFGAAIPEGTLQRTLKALSDGEDPLTSGAGTPDKLSGVGDAPLTSASGTPDKLSGTPDIAMSPDPSLSVNDPSVGEIWTQILSALKLAMTRGTFNSCLLGSRPLAMDGETLTIEVRFSHAVPRLENRLAPVIARVAAFYLPGVQIRFVPPGTQHTSRTTQPAPDQPPPPAPSQPPLSPLPSPPSPSPAPSQPPLSPVHRPLSPLPRPLPPPPPTPPIPTPTSPLPSPPSIVPSPLSPLPRPPPPSSTFQEPSNYPTS